MGRGGKIQDNITSERESGKWKKVNNTGVYNIGNVPVLKLNNRFMVLLYYYQISMLSKLYVYYKYSFVRMNYYMKDIKFKEASW